MRNQTGEKLLGAGVEIEPGQLRSLLQPVIFVAMMEDLEDSDLTEGDVVGAQFWGEGRVMLTRVTDGYQTMRTARKVRVRTLGVNQDLYDAIQPGE